MENMAVMDLLNRKYEFESRVIKGLASGEEIDTMIANVATNIVKLDREADNAEIADLLDIFSYARDTSYKDLVAGYLEGPGPSSAHIALSVLCIFYKLTAQYAQQIAYIIRGTVWDYSDSLHEYATGIAASYLRGNGEPTLLRALIEAVEDRAITEEQRENAWAALLVAMRLVEPRGASREEVTESPPLSDPVVLLLAKERLAKEERESKARP